MKVKRDPFFRKPLLTLCVGGLLLSIVSCGTVPERSEKDYKGTEKATLNLANKAGATENSQPVFVRKNALFVDKTSISSIELIQREALPDAFREEIEMNYDGSESLNDILSRITKTNGLSFALANDVFDAKATEPGKVLGANSSSSGGTAAAAAAGGSGNPVAATGQSRHVQESFIRVGGVRYSGDVIGLLDVLASKTDLSWRWTGQSVEFYKYSTKVFHLDALVGLSKTVAEMSTSATSTASTSTTAGSGGSTGNSGTTGQDTKLSMITSIWEEVGTSLSALLSDKGVITMSPSAGLVTVHDKPENIHLIESQVKEFNRIYSKQVLLDVDVYSVDDTGDNTTGIDWNQVFASASSNFGLGLVTPGTPVGPAGSPSTFTYTRNAGMGQLTGTSMLSLLDQVGHSSLMTRGTLISLNGQTVPLSVSEQVSYLASISTMPAITAGVAPTTTLTPGVITEGFSMNFTPRVTEDNRVALRYTIDISTLVKMNSFTSNGSEIQLPDLAVRNFMQNVSLKSGETLVLSGFQQILASTTNTGMASSLWWWLGGNQASQSVRRTIIIVITPRILE